MRSKCKYYDPHLETIKEYIGCLYSLEGCGTGGLLHILLDDDNYNDGDIAFCWKECLLHPEKEESGIGCLICEEYMKLSMEQRRLLTCDYIGHWSCMDKDENCEHCCIHTGFNYEE